LDVALVKAELARAKATILSEAYLSPWLFIHARHRLQLLGLSGWERWLWPWQLKLAAELLLQWLAGDHLPRVLRGLDIWMAVRKEGFGPRIGDGSLNSVFSCPRCRGQLLNEGRDFACSCGNRLSLDDGLWAFGS
jgi:hypothetical protein